MILIMNSHNMSEMYITGKFKGMLFIVLMHSGIQVLIKVMCLNIHSKPMQETFYVTFPSLSSHKQEFPICLGFGICSCSLCHHHQTALTIHMNQQRIVYTTGKHIKSLTEILIFKVWQKLCFQILLLGKNDWKHGIG